MKRKRELIDDILRPNYNFYANNEPDEDILKKCLKCGFEEPVPSYIYAEFRKKKIHKEIKKIVCQRCDVEKFIPKEYFKG